MFDNLTNRLSNSFKILQGKNKLSEGNIKDAIRQVRRALLEADVALDVIKVFLDQVQIKALGLKVGEGLSPSQAFIKLVEEELTKIIGVANESLDLKTQPPAVVMVAGLQGAGKTTSIAKLALFLKEREKKKVLLVSADVYRPAAIDQLQILSEQVGVDFFPSSINDKPEQIVLNAKKHAQKQFHDVLLVDTAGRLHIDEQMMSEIKQIESIINPTETFLVADSLTGQVAAEVAKEFKNTVNLTGIVLTRADGDARGGAAVSMKYVSNVPIKFLGIGEKIENLEVFHPDRIANRILGMGDIVSLVEKASQDLSEDNLKKTEENLKRGSFSMEDYLTQLRQMKKMGGIEGVMSFLPGVSKIKSQMDQAGVDESIISQNEAIILSMTKKERENPKIIDGSRRKRIANGSGTDVATINKLLKQFKMMSEMMKKMSKGNTKGMTDKGIPPELFNQLK